MEWETFFRPFLVSKLRTIPPLPRSSKALGRGEGAEVGKKESGSEGVPWCHGVSRQVPFPQERLPVVPAGPEQHNAAASAVPCCAVHPPPPLPPSVAGPHGLGCGTGATHSGAQG